MITLEKNFFFLEGDQLTTQLSATSLDDDLNQLLESYAKEEPVENDSLQHSIFTGNYDSTNIYPQQQSQFIEYYSQPNSQSQTGIFSKCQLFSLNLTIFII